jgi:hypothetical protein
VPRPQISPSRIEGPSIASWPVALVSEFSALPHLDTSIPKIIILHRHTPSTLSIVLLKTY